MNLYDRILDKSQCCGCKACAVICPVDAISFEEDQEGFQYPVIQMEKCIHCEKCDQVCPVENINNSGFALHAYAAIHKDQQTLKRSSSGGAFSAIAETVLHKDGVVFGAVLRENKVMHCSTTNLDGLDAMRGSKYVQSDLEDTLQEVVQYIRQNKTVLFSGTPCQCAAVRNLVGKNEERLITLDFVCHGVPSPAVFSDYIEWLSRKYCSEIKYIGFRAKTPKCMGIIETFNFAEKNKQNVAYNSKYLTGFLKNILFRPSCYTCPYARKQRVSDITVCDFWGCERYYPQLDAKKGISGIIVNSEIGDRWVDEAASMLELIPTTVDIIAAGNANMNYPTPKPKERDMFYEDRVILEFDELADKYLDDPEIWKKRLIAIIPQKIKRIVKKLMR